MKKTLSALSLLLLAGPAVSYASSEQLVPAGSLVQCIVSDAKISSKTTAIGDPVLCRLTRVEQYGRSELPYGSYLVGHFEDYKDPGHFVGKGWMELKFDRLVMQPDVVIPISARVVEVPKYNVDKNGRILGNGHPVRDTVEWLIPVLWPIDLINLPRRGPRPVLKPETRLTLKLMDDMGIPSREDSRREQAALIERAPAPQQAYAPQPNYTPQPTYAPQQSYAPAPAQVINQFAAPQPPQVINQYAAVPQPPVVVHPQVVYPYPMQPRVVVPYGYAGYGGGYGYYRPY
jgi:hypothetical protein